MTREVFDVFRPLARLEKGQGGRKYVGITEGVDWSNREWVWEGGGRKTMIAQIRILKDKNYACQF